MTRLDRDEDQAFVSEAVESGAFDRYRLWVEQVDLDSPVRVARFIVVVVLSLFALTDGVGALELVARQSLLAEAAGVANAVADQFARQLVIPGGGIADSVFLAGEVGVLGGETVGMVVAGIVGAGAVRTMTGA